MADKKGGVATDTIMSPAEMKPLLMLSKHQPVSAVVGMTKDKDGVILLSRRLKPKKLLVQLKADARKAKVDLDITSLRFGKAEVDTDKDSGLVMFTVNKDAPGALRMKLLELIKRVPLAKVEIDVDAKIEAEPEEDDEQPDASHDSPPADAAPQATQVNNAAPQAANLDMPPLAATDHDVFFSRDSAVLTSDDEKSLAAYADRYIKNADPIQITVVGYASMDGDPTENQRLSQHRAEAVKKFLSDKQGIKGDLIKTDWHGATDQFRDHPPASNRRAVFGPPIAAPSASDKSGSGKTDGGTTGGNPSAGGTDGGDDKSKPATATTQVKAPPDQTQTLPHPEAVRVWGLDAVGNYTQGWRGGKQPAPLQAQVNLTFPTITIDLGKKGNWDFSAVNQPQIGLAGDHGGISGQAAINLFQAVWKDKYGPRVEVDLQAQITNLKLDENPQFGGQVQVELKLNRTWGVTAFLQSASDEKAGTHDFETNFAGGFGIVVHILKGPGD
jgi:outer membrane protein OmpA-like peptidoglycan-associated protein